MKRKYSLDVVAFIKEVKKYRQIWDMNDVNYKRRKKVTKSGVWRDVATALIPDYDTMTQTERLDISRKLYSKWRNMKDSHIRILRRKNESETFSYLNTDKPSGRKKNTPYIYAKHLSFINSQYNYKPGQCGNDDERTHLVGTFTITVSGVNDSDSTDYNSGTSGDDTVSTRDHESSTSQAIEFVDTPVPNMEVTGHNPERDDADLSFFDSTLPVVREFNMDQKLEFRCDVLKLINYIRSESKDIAKPGKME